jgi:DNA-binding transcriptional regulator LsrR (DeoR family)
LGLEHLKEVDRAIGIAGGSRKFAAIRGAHRGGLINILITGSCTAEKIVNDQQNLNQCQDENLGEIDSRH